MTPLDYGRSFLIGKAPENEVRFWVESRTRVLANGGESEDYVQAGSCKSERTFADKELFQDDNYDFLPVFGPEWGIIYRRKASLDPGYRSIVPVDQMWNGQTYHLAEAPGATELKTTSAIREATYAFAPIVAQVEIHNEETGLAAVVEFPVKTMNTHRGRDLYQVDSGPVILPDLMPRPRMADGMDLAFVAFNAPEFADFVVEVPTQVGEAAQTHHFSKRISLPARNRLFALE
ncbi:hypothetical protein ACFL6X_00030 [Candidatus Latescibacterota bacterium]